MHNDLYFLCRKICGRTEAKLCRLFKEFGLNSAQGSLALLVLRAGEEGTTLTELHEETGIAMSALSASVQIIRAKGFVCVSPAADDSRKKIIAATEKLRALTERLQEIETKMHRAFCREIGEERLESVCETLSKIVSVQRNA